MASDELWEPSGLPSPLVGADNEPHHGHPPPLGPDVELVIYRVAQEGLFNVVRHAGASDTSLSLQVEEESLVLEVRDNGEGLPKVLPTSSAGISGMRERALLVGGQLDIRPRAGGGTQLQLRIPKGSTGA